MLGIGQTVTVVDLVLEVDERALGTIVGRARLQGAAERTHAGIRVEAVGSRSTTFTGDDGTFRLDAAAGLHNLTFSFRGFGVTPYPGVRVELGAETTLPHEIVLNARPGRVRVTITLSEGFEAPDRLGDAHVRLVAVDAAPDADASYVGVPHELPGHVLFEEVLPGTWRLEASLDGFAGTSMRVALEPGEDYDAGRVVLVLASAADFGAGRSSHKRDFAALPHLSQRGRHRPAPRATPPRYLADRATPVRNADQAHLRRCGRARHVQSQARTLIVSCSG